MGFRLLESPEDSSGSQLGLTSLTLFTIDNDPADDEERYNLMAGLTTSGDPRAGGPFDEDGAPNDKRFCLSTGPFSLTVGNSVRVAFGIIAGQNDSLLKSNSDYAWALYRADFTGGDVNADGNTSISDIVYLISYLFKQGPAPEPIQTGDTNCDGNVSVSDIVYLIVYLFKQGNPPCK